jgi:hypothetical protein
MGEGMEVKMTTIAMAKGNRPSRWIHDYPGALLYVAVVVTLILVLQLITLISHLKG